MLTKSVAKYKESIVVPIPKIILIPANINYCLSAHFLH